MASIRCVRPDLTTGANSTALRFSAPSRCRSAGTSSFTSMPVAARWIEVGNTSLEDCEALTWSFGCTGRPRRSSASVAMTSLAFMFEDVPEPVWKTSIGKWSSYSPSATASAAFSTASATVASSTPRSAFTRAAAALIRASAAICARSRRCPEIGKFSTARCVCARHLAHDGSRTSPMESCSTRCSCSDIQRLPER